MLNKFILIAIAAGLWANVLATIIHPAHADVASDISHIDDMVFDIAMGNSKIC